jgi:hypothetical protein
MRVLNSTFVATLVLAMGLATFSAGASEVGPEADGDDTAATAKTADSETAASGEVQPTDGLLPEQTPIAQPPQVPKRPIYKPPSPGKPVRTVGGGSRGTSNRVPKLFTLTPKHVGHTIADQPSLFWFIDDVSAAMQVDFVLLDADGVEPIVETTLATPESAGIQRIRLEDYGAELSPGTEYEWSVTLIVDPDKRSRDIVVMGWIDRVEPSGQLTAQLEALDPAAVAAAYAEAGLWYDTVAAISDQIERNPEDPALVQQRADVLRQVGLTEAAEAGS